MRIWSRLGVCAGVLGFVYITLSELIRRTELGRGPFWLVGWSLVGAGTLLIALCLIIYGKDLGIIWKALFPKKPADGAAVEAEEADISTKELNRLHAAILILATGGMMVALFPPIPNVDAQAPASPTNGVRRPTAGGSAFPEIEIQGITLRQGANCVLINRRTYFEGDTVRGARIHSITASNITIEVQGQFKVIHVPTF